MLHQHEDGSHEITLRNIRCPGCELHPATSGVVHWRHDSGVRYELNFDGIYSLEGSKYYASRPLESKGVGRLSSIDTSQPNWIAETDEGNLVKLYGANDTPTSTRTRGTAGPGVSCRFEGNAMFTVIEFSTDRTLAFENATTEDYRMFFTGSAGARHHKTESVEFCDELGTITTSGRCSITLSESPAVSLVNANALVNLEPSGWLAFENAPTEADCETAGFAEQTFVSFLNGDKIPFHWTDRRVSPKTIRRTYFGWVRSRNAEIGEALRQPLPILNGIELFSHGDEVLKGLPKLFEKFTENSGTIDFPSILHPLWTATNSVMQDRLALASVSLERVSTQWKSLQKSLPKEQKSVWKNRPLLRSLRKQLTNTLAAVLDERRGLDHCKSNLIAKLVGTVRDFVSSDSCQKISEDERRELYDVLVARIGNLTGPPNADSLKAPFVDLLIPLSDEDLEALKKRNDALHGRVSDSELKSLDQETKYFDRLSMLVTKFVLALCEYDGPYIDYASRPVSGNFEIKRLDSANPSN